MSNTIHYKLNIGTTGKEFVIKTQDGTNLLLDIPFSDGNCDYQEYLKWVAEGNTPEPADE